MANKSLSNAASRTATSALQSIPFENIIGGPLEACINAQSLAAQTTVNFIESIGLNEVPQKDAKGNIITYEGTKDPVMVKEAVYVSFQFIQGGRLVRLNIPLLSIVPIPYICINTIDINFKANITGMSAVSNEASDSTSNTQNESRKTKKGGGWLSKRVTTNFSSSLSSKKDSKATQNSQYSVEYTMDVAVHASQDSMPAGMSKMLEMIGSAMDLCSPDGEFVVNGQEFLIPWDQKEKTARLEVSYKTPDGILMPNGFKLTATKGKVGNKQNDKYTAWYELTEGTYELKSDDATQSMTIVVTNEPNPEVKP